MTEKEKESFRFFKEIFDLHLTAKYPDLAQFTLDRYTKELSKIIPLTYLKALVRHYRLFAHAADRPKNPAREVSKFSNDPLNAPLKDIQVIEETLKNLKRGKWLSELGELQVMNLFLKNLADSQNGVERSFQFAKGKFRNSGPWPDYALRFIVFFLVTYAKKAIRTPCFEKVSEFLTEQDIGPEGFDAEKVKKTYDRPSDVQNFHDALMQKIEGDFFNGLFKTMDSICKHQPDIPIHLRGDFHKFCLPEMIEFHPDHPRWKDKIIP